MLFYLRSNLYKFRKSALFWLMFVLPILIIPLFISYYSVASWSLEEKLVAYFQSLSLLMPCLVSILCAHIGQQEQRAGAAFNILCVGKSRIRMFFSIFILLYLLISISLTLASLGFYFFWGQMSLNYYILTSILLLIPLASLLLIQIFITLRFGSSWCMAIGAILLLIGALGITGLFDYSWYYIPSIWATRFTSLMILDYFYPDKNVELVAELRTGLLYCVLFSLCLLILVPIWFHKWDGRSSVAEE